LQPLSWPYLPWQRSPALGYTNVSGLTKDENGVWHGSATKDGKTLTVAVDVKGAPSK
jgi:hypothetical protein